jgi:hypothetical protein
MDELLPRYERELALLRRSVHDFAARYPKIAARLGLTDGEIADPHVDRLLQTFASAPDWMTTIRSSVKRSSTRFSPNSYVPSPPARSHSSMPAPRRAS